MSTTTQPNKDTTAIISVLEEKHVISGLKPPSELDLSIQAATRCLFSHRHEDGYWWYTLEANDAINAEMIFLNHYLGLGEPQQVSAIARWLVHNQNPDGSWCLCNGSPGDLSATVECYVALRIAGYAKDCETLTKARAFILANGGVSRVRIFTRIHLAMLGIIDWSLCPQMPISLIQFPKQAPINIYEFSSWARASIVPLLIILDYKKTVKAEQVGDLSELYLVNQDLNQAWKQK